MHTRESGTSWLAICCTTLLALAVLAPAPVAAGIVVDGPSICRGAGYWSTHSGTEKGGPDQMLALLGEAGCLEVCGEIVDDTDWNSADSAVEGTCISPKASPQVKLARQLLAQAMNCIISTGSPDCDPEPWEICNAACADPEGPYGVYTQECLAYLDCQASGGLYLGGGQCQTGSCAPIPVAPSPEGNGGSACGPGLPACDFGYACVPTEGCDDADLVNEALGIDWTTAEANASSSKKCNKATKSACTITGAGESACATGTESEDPEECPEPACADGFTCGDTPVNCEGSLDLGCMCFTTAEGGTACSSDGATPCFATTDCTTSAECEIDEVCVVDACCGNGECLQVGGPEICTDTLAPERGRAGAARFDTPLRRADR